MDKIDAMLISLEPEIDKKCMEIKQKKSEKMLTKLFILLAAAFLIIPVILVMFGASLLTIFIPIIVTAIGFAVSSPILISKGA